MASEINCCAGLAAWSRTLVTRWVRVCLGVSCLSLAIFLGYAIGFWVVEEAVEASICPSRFALHRVRDPAETLCYATFFHDSPLMESCIETCTAGAAAGASNETRAINALCRSVRTRRVPEIGIHLPCVRALVVDPLQAFLDYCEPFTKGKLPADPSLLTDLKNLDLFGDCIQHMTALQDRRLWSTLLDLVPGLGGIPSGRQDDGLYIMSRPYLLTPGDGASASAVIPSPLLPPGERHQRLPDTVLALLSRSLNSASLVQSFLYPTVPARAGLNNLINEFITGVTGPSFLNLDFAQQFFDPTVAAADISLAVKITPTVGDFTEYVEGFYNGGEGIDLRREDPSYPITERLANHFQNSWMSQLLSYDDVSEEYSLVCHYDTLLQLAASDPLQSRAPPILVHGLTPCGTTGNGSVGTCEATNGAPASAPRNALNSHTGTLMHGGSREGRLVFHLVDGVLKPKPCSNATTAELAGVPCVSETSRPDLIPGLVHCAHEGAQFYHTTLHIASAAMSYSAQNIARDEGPDSAVFRLLTPGGDATSGINSAALGTLIEQSGFGSRKFNNADVAVAKRTATPILTDPCSPERYWPRGAVPEEAKLLFNPVGQAAQRVVCRAENRLTLPEAAIRTYTQRLAEPAATSCLADPPLETCPSGLDMAAVLDVPVEEVGAAIEPWEPPVSAFMIGIEHALTFSVNLLAAELPPQDATDAMYGVTGSPFAFGAAFYRDVITWALITVLSKHTIAQCSSPVDTYPGESLHLVGGSLLETVGNFGTVGGMEAMGLVGGNRQTSVQNEMLIVAAKPDAVRFGYTPTLRRMSAELSGLWEEVTGEMQASFPEMASGPDTNNIQNVSFVYGAGKCIPSSTWV